jgi:hypothetical protein
MQQNLDCPQSIQSQHAFCNENKKCEEQFFFKDTQGGCVTFSDEQFSCIVYVVKLKSI